MKLERASTMMDFNSVLDQARQLAPEDQAKLIVALWDSAPCDVEVPLHPEWAVELERRMAAIRAGTSKPIPWDQIRDEALARIGHGTSR
jgi:putative addiction module component (TIGR02574 family)